jgi:hypothetical protein
MRIDNPSFNPLLITATASLALSASHLIGFNDPPPVTVSGSAPTDSVEVGDLWYNNTNGNTYIYQSASTWVPISADGGGGSNGATRRFTRSATAQPWVLNHNFNTTDVFVQVYDQFGNAVIPRDISLTDDNNVTLYFDAIVAGKAIITTGAGVGVATTAETASYAVESLYSRPTYAIYSSYADTNTGNDGFTKGGVAAFDSTVSGYKVNNDSLSGQFGEIYKEVVGFDFTKDFILEASVYIATYIDLNNTGDFAEIYAGANSSITANGTAEATAGQLGIGLYMYPAGTINDGVNIDVNGTWTYQVGDGDFLDNMWMRFFLETTTDRSTGRRLATIKRQSLIGGSQMLGGIDITNWTPGGNYIGVRSQTGAARMNFYTSFIQLQYK